MTKWIRYTAIGLATGLANGLFGAGGGSLAVPAMERFLNVKAHTAHASAIAIILPLSVISAFVYVKSGQVDWLNVLYISIGGVVGGYLGAKLLPKVPSKWLHKVFGLCIIAAAVRMIF